MAYIIKYKQSLKLIITILLMFIISIISISKTTYNYLVLKQILWYLIGIILIIIIIKNKFKINILLLYILGNLSLLGLLLFTKPLNNAKCWYQIFNICTIEPSEFMKIILIFTITSILIKYKNPNLKQELLLILKVFIITIIPAILTFLEPDTGTVIIYFLITFIMLFISGIRYRWFILIFIFIIIIISIILSIYYLYRDLFINIFGSSFFLRIDRLLDWSNKDGYQLNNSLIALGSSGILGFNKTPLYFPEAHTDFIFATYASNYGFIGSLLLLLLITYLDINIIKIALNCKKRKNKFIVSGIIGMLFYQQLQNIGMTFGLLPITGIPLPFISYGGSSIISYMICLGIILKISLKQKKDDNHLSKQSLLILK